MKVHDATLRPLLNIMDSAYHNPVASLSSKPWVAEQQSVGPRVALIFKSIIILLIIFLGFIKGALYRIWCGVNILGDSGVKVV